MRQIEIEMNNAVRNKIAWSKSNTVTTFDNTLENCFVYLHGNHIATYNYANKKLELYSGGGWFTNTTKSRLNALIQEFSKGGIFQKNFNWFLKSFGATVPFCEGITLPII